MNHVSVGTLVFAIKMSYILKARFLALCGRIGFKLDFEFTEIYGIGAFFPQCDSSNDRNLSMAKQNCLSLCCLHLQMLSLQGCGFFLFPFGSAKIQPIITLILHMAINIQLKTPAHKIRTY